VEGCVNGNAVNQTVLEKQCYLLIIPADLLFYYRYIWRAGNIFNNMQAFIFHKISRY